MRALAVVVAVAAGCGGRAVPAAPRSSCADAAASIVRGLRATGHQDAGALEPRLAATCRSARWRPNLVRCFALARDPGEHRVCARRLEVGQRIEVRAIEDELDGGPTRVAPLPASGLPPRCEQLAVAYEQFLTCPPLVAAYGPQIPEVSSWTERALAQATAAVGRRDVAMLQKADADCAALGERLAEAVARAGC